MFDLGGKAKGSDALTQLDFSFVVLALQSFPKILDNIGVLKIGNATRFGVLITKEKEGLFLSLID